MEQGKYEKAQEILPNAIDLWLCNMNNTHVNKRQKIMEENEKLPDDFKTSQRLNDKNFNIEHNLMETVDLSDLSFSSYNDFIFGDCASFEDASQHVDPAIGNVDGDPLSFNNSNSVQLFKDNDTRLQCYKTEDSLSLDNLIVSRNNNDEYHRVVDGIDEFYKDDSCDFYHVFELIDDAVMHTRDKNTQNDKPLQVKIDSVKIKKHKSLKKNKDGKMAIPIRKGRRYLPNFKQKVLEYAATHTFKETASHFNINCNTITEWSRESKRLSFQNKSTTSLPGTVSNHKTDINGTSVTKTDIILLNDEFSLETELTETQNIEKDLPPCNMRSDERFLKWIQKKRLEKKQLSRNEVYHVARYCLKKCPPCHDEPVWFVLWFRRFNKALLQNSVKSNSETEKYIMYPNNFKVEVALYAKLFTKNSAARVFNVPRRRMFDWFKQVNPEAESLDLKNEDDSAVAPVDEDMRKNKDKNKIYVELHEWYQKMVEEGLSPSSSEIKTKAKEVFSLHGIEDIKFSEGWLQKFCKRCNIKLRHNGDDHLLIWILAQFDNNVSLSHQQITEISSKLIGRKREFKGSKGWTLRFLKRHSKFLQFVPTIEDKLPQIMNEKLNNFWNEIDFRLKTFQLNSENMGCMDEIPIGFNYPQEEKAANLPLLRKTGFENCQAVVILCAMADGRILPPAVIFKGNGPKQLLTDGNEEILILYQQDGFVDLNITSEWVQNLWLNCMKTPSLLIVDSFEPHCSPQFRNHLAKENCHLSIIPEGCSSQLQPLAVEVAPFFQKMIKNEWEKFPMMAGPHSSKNQNRCKCPDQDTILNWIRIAYKKIKQNPISIINGFKITGLLK